jgi:hypothetical protein
MCAQICGNCGAEGHTKYECPKDCTHFPNAVQSKIEFSASTF